MNYVDVYMLKSDSTRGNAYSAGYIYYVEEHIAKELNQAGKGKVINYQSLNSHQKNVERELSNLELSIEKIKTDYRLTDEAKREDIQKLISDAEVTINGFQEKYNTDLQRLQLSAKEKASQFGGDVVANPEQARIQAGMIRAEVEMSSSISYAAEAIQSKLDVIDKSTARELLAQFTELKKILEEKGSHISKTLLLKTIRNVYDGLKKAAEDESQVIASNEYKMLEAIKQFRGDITAPFKRVKSRYK